MGASNTVFAITLEGDACRLVRGTRSGRRIVTRVEARSDSSEDPAFRTAVQSANFEVDSGKAVWAMVMPGVSCLLRWIPVPFASIKKSSEVLPSLLDIQIPFPVETCTHGVARWAEEGGGHRAQVFAAREEDVQRQVDLLHDDLAVDPEWLVHEGLMMSAAGALGLPCDGDRLLVMAGGDRLFIAYLINGVLEHFFSVRMAADATSLPAVVEQAVARVQRAAGSDLSVDGVLWFGSRSCSAAARVHLEALCKTSGSVAEAKDAGDLSTKLLAAFVLQQKSPALNLRQGRHTHPARLQKDARLVASTRRSLMAAAIVLMILSLGWLSFLKQTESGMRDQLKLKAEQLAPGKRVFPGQEVLIVNRALEESRDLRRSLVAYSRGGVQPSVTRIAEAAAEHGVTLRLLKLGEGGVTVEGVADQEREALAFLALIESSTGRLSLTQQRNVEGFSFSAEGPGV